MPAAPKLSSPHLTHSSLRVCPPAQVVLFKETKFDVPLKALPFRPIEKNDEVVVCVPYTNDDGILIPEYWYGIISVLCANACWIKFYDVTALQKIAVRNRPVTQNSVRSDLRINLRKPTQAYALRRDGPH